MLRVFLLSIIFLNSACHSSSKLEEIVQASSKSKSDALFILKDQQVLIALNAEGAPIETMSVTKSMVSLAIGMLIDEGKIGSIDDPLEKYYPKWKHGPALTIRHLLSHTSGLQPKSIEEMGDATDTLQQALENELSSKPGEVFVYNNSAVNLLSGIVEKASGQRLDLYLKERLFVPLGIEKFGWFIDKAGHATATSGLKMGAKDLAKIGQLILQKGKWKGQQIISSKWIDLSMQASQSLEPSCGLLWWLDDAAYIAQGYRGQYLVIIPETGIIGVRQIESSKKEGDSFEKFPELLMELSQESSAPVSK